MNSMSRFIKAITDMMWRYATNLLIQNIRYTMYDNVD